MEGNKRTKRTVDDTIINALKSATGTTNREDDDGECGVVVDKPFDVDKGPTDLRRTYGFSKKWTKSGKPEKQFDECNYVSYNCKPEKLMLDAYWLKSCTNKFYYKVRLSNTVLDIKGIFQYIITNSSTDYVTTLQKLVDEIIELYDIFSGDSEPKKQTEDFKNDKKNRVLTIYESDIKPALERAPDWTEIPNDHIVLLLQLSATFPRLVPFFDMKPELCQQVKDMWSRGTNIYIRYLNCVAVDPLIDSLKSPLPLINGWKAEFYLSKGKYLARDSDKETDADTTLKQSEEICKMALNIFLSTKRIDGAVDTYNTLCTTYRRLGNDEKSKTCCAKGINLFEEAENKRIHFSVGRTSWEHLRKKLEINRSKNGEDAKLTHYRVKAPTLRLDTEINMKNDQKFREELEACGQATSYPDNKSEYVFKTFQNKDPN